MFANWRRKYDFTDVLLWIIGGGLLIFIIYGSYVTLSSGKYTLEQWLNFAVFGLAQGGIYALIALGYTMVYGILGMINFAHGEFFMFGAFGAFFMAEAMASTGLLESNPILAIMFMLAAAMIVAATIAVLAERIAYRPLRRSPRLVPLITAIGVSYFLQYTARGLFGSGVEAFPNVPALSGAVDFGPVSIQRSQIVVFAATGILLTLLWLFVSKTKIGRAIRSVAEDKDAAALMGVDVDRTIAISFAVGGIMAGAAGVMYGLVYRQVAFYMGFVPGLKAFTAAVLGGIGNLAGAVLGGLILGVIESVGPSLFLDGMGIPVPPPAQRRHRLHCARPHPDLPPVRYPRRAAVEASLTAGGAWYATGKTLHAGRRRPVWPFRRHRRRVDRPGGHGRGVQQDRHHCGRRLPLAGRPHGDGVHRRLLRRRARPTHEPGAHHPGGHRRRRHRRPGDRCAGADHRAAQPARDLRQRHQTARPLAHAGRHRRARRRGPAGRPRRAGGPGGRPHHLHSQAAAELHPDRRRGRDLDWPAGRCARGRAAQVAWANSSTPPMASR